MISTLKTAKKENRELKSQIENLQDQNEDLVKQVELTEKHSINMQN